MNAWPTFHRDGTVTVHGDLVGRKFLSVIGGYRFACRCGYTTTYIMVRGLRLAVSKHLDTQEHLDREAS